ncbi:DNA cytosine methyltransferase [Vibrio metschnikovii]|nr:DNA cytosine methyltransferase [Vibrio metschnikovii]EKO3681154.1 DNA cytosine methyltransferase [Vibrio metschnikovii]EKO3703062.1 DNA cytosine methyltransferase [Vibrio metschnikovii]EKO3775239.1 DNA cytosine methyltransferase [Vibrio metschnikovii]ELF5344730.1 DNA cytosine methyltransferase [Vibrio metschnikovii]
MKKNRLILSLFPGIDLFSKPFERRGFCVVRGPDILLGQDIRDFHVPKGVFSGVIGGSPCQEFSSLNRNEPTGYGLEMLNEYKRIVLESSPDWFLLENVARVSNLKIEGYSWQRFPLNLAWYTDCSRLRHFQFGSKNGVKLNPPIHVTKDTTYSAVTASDCRSFSQLKKLQGLPDSFDLPSFTVEGKKRAVGNGVPLPLGNVLASLIDRDYYNVTDQDDKSVTQPVHKSVSCNCGCGVSLVGRQLYASSACRKRAERARSNK